MLNEVLISVKIHVTESAILVVDPVCANSVRYRFLTCLPRQISVMAFLSPPFRPPTKFFESHIFYFGKVANKSKVLFISIICEIFFTL